MKFAISVPIGSWHEQLPTALSSLLIQPVEKEIAILDASNDPRVSELIRSHENHFDYVRQGPDQGQSDAILEGWQNIDGDWLGWLNADDALMPDALQRIQNEWQKDQSLEVIYGHSIIIDDDSQIRGYHFNVEPPSDRLLQAGIISQPSCLFSRAAYERAGGLDRDLHYVMDWDLWIRMYLLPAKFGFVDHPLSQVVWGADTKTASLGKQRRAELMQLIKRHAAEQSQSTVYRDFLLHAFVDRIWPNALKQRIQKKLRSAGQTVFGIRGDGLVSEKATLFVPIFQSAKALDISFSGSVKDTKFSCLNLRIKTLVSESTVRLEFSKPTKQPVLMAVEISNQNQDELFFKHAKLITT